MSDRVVEPPMVLVTEDMMAEIERLKGKLGAAWRCMDVSHSGNVKLKAERDEAMALLRTKRPNDVPDAGLVLLTRLVVDDYTAVESGRALYMRQLVDAEAERDRLQADLETLRSECASISAEFGLPPSIRPAEGEITRMLHGWRVEREAHEKTKASCAVLREALEAYLDTCEAWGDVRRCECECCVPARAALAGKEGGNVRDEHLTLEERIAEALQRIKLGQGQMRIPAEATDPDLVLFDCRKRIAELEAQNARLEKKADTAHRMLEMFGRLAFASSKPGKEEFADAAKAFNEAWGPEVSAEHVFEAIVADEQPKETLLAKDPATPEQIEQAKREGKDFRREIERQGRAMRGEPKEPK